MPKRKPRTRIPTEAERLRAAAKAAPTRVYLKLEPLEHRRCELCTDRFVPGQPIGRVRVAATVRGISLERGAPKTPVGRHTIGFILVCQEHAAELVSRDELDAFVDTPGDGTP